MKRARLGSARLGSARLGSARLGSARLGSARLGSALNYTQPLGPEAAQDRPVSRRRRAPVPQAPALPRRPARSSVAHRCRHFPSRARLRPSEPWPRLSLHVPSPASHPGGPGIRPALRGGAWPQRDARRGSILDQTKFLIQIKKQTYLTFESPSPHARTGMNRPRFVVRLRPGSSGNGRGPTWERDAARPETRGRSLNQGGARDGCRRTHRAGSGRR